jgi:hypothetical protein
MKESFLKNSCESFLGALQNMGQLLYLRLQSGNLIIGEGEARRRVRCCPPGTSDNLVILSNPTRVVFVEYKGDGGKQTREQKAFEKMIEEQGHEYWLVYDFEAFRIALQEIMED